MCSGVSSELKTLALIHQQMDKKHLHKTFKVEKEEDNFHSVYSCVTFLLLLLLLLLLQLKTANAVQKQQQQQQQVFFVTFFHELTLTLKLFFVSNKV